MTHRYQRIEQDLTEQILSGRLAARTRLPSVRRLCQQHQAAKGTVLHALQRLEARGLIEARPRSGFYVCSGHSSPASSSFTPAPVAARVSDILVDIMQAGSAFDLVPGAGDDPTAGFEALNRSMNRAMRHQRGRSHLYYDTPLGSERLRQQLALRLQQRGCALTATDLCITSGCQNALFLALMATCQPGDLVAVESPGFYGVLQLLQQLRLRVIEIPSSAHTGMMMDQLADAAHRWDIRACVVSPCFSTPAGALMPEDARHQLLQLASEHDFAVIEDDIYVDTAQSGIPDPLKRDDTEGRVILCSSFSKSLSRDLRIGWISAGRWQANVSQLKLVSQLASPGAVQEGVAEFLENGGYRAHLKRQQQRLNQQRDTLMTQLQHWPLKAAPPVPAGGLTVWAELEDTVDTTRLYQQLKKEGVWLTPGQLFSGEERFRHHLRISFAHNWNGQRLAALEKTGTAIRNL